MKKSASALEGAVEAFKGIQAVHCPTKKKPNGLAGSETLMKWGNCGSSKFV